MSDVFDEELGLVVTEHRPNCGGECIEAGCTIEEASDGGEDRGFPQAPIDGTDPHGRYA